MNGPVLQIIPTLDQGGAEKQMTLLACGLKCADCDVHVCAITRGGPWSDKLAEAGVPLTIIGKRWKADPLAYWRLERYVRALRPRLVQTWLFAANSYGRLAATRAGVPAIVAGERCVDRWKTDWQFTIDRFLARRTDRITVNSSGVRTFYEQHGLPSEKFVVIPNGIELPSPPEESRSAILEELGLPPDAKLIGAVGRLWPQKRIKDLMWAADLLKTIHKDTHLLVIGDGPLWSKLHQYRRQIHIEDRVHLLGHRTDVPRLMPHFDVLWLGSGYEGLPNSVMEAMSHSVPVVATDIPGNRDLVIPDETGYLVPVGDRAAFARWTHKVLDDPQLAARLGQAGRDRIAKEFTVEQMIDRYAKLYRQLMS